MEPEALGFFEGLWEWYRSGGASVWFSAVTAVLTASTAFTMLTPSSVDNKIVNGLLKVVNFLAGNVLRNRNADD